MPDTDISSAVASDLTNAMTDYSVDTESTDATGSGKETSYTNADWNQQLGYYTKIPELQAVIDAKATWTVGKGFIADEFTTFLLDMIGGTGVDTFNTILENMIRTYHIGGDSFAEVIRDDDDKLINLKPLAPETMKIVANNKGVIIRYEQTNKDPKKDPIKFAPEEIFHLARNRVADEIHGQSMIKALVDTILRINEAKSDWQRVLHRNIDPLWIFHLDTDDTAKIAAFKTKQDAARGAGENMYIPKGAVVPELVSVASNAALNPLPWIEAETGRFYEASGVPRIVLGGTGAITEAAVKIAYLAFQQTIEEEQLFIEEQILVQLGLTIELEFPASLENEMLSDKPKEEMSPEANPPEIENEQASQPNDTTAEMEGKK